MRVVAVVQARMGSSRLPGKVLRSLGGSPVLSWVLRAARATAGVDEVVVATTTSPADDVLAEIASAHGAGVVRGPEDDVLTRFVQALDAHPADAVVRLTADCPLLDPALIGQVVAAWRYDPSWDYVATTLVRSLPRGLDVELVTAQALRDADSAATAHHRQHVTSWLYTEPAGRRLLGLNVWPTAEDLRVTLDTDSDWQLLEALVADLGNRVIGWPELTAYLRARPQLAARNAQVETKPLELG